MRSDRQSTGRPRRARGARVPVHSHPCSSRFFSKRASGLPLDLSGNLSADLLGPFAQASSSQRNSIVHNETSASCNDTWGRGCDVGEVTLALRAVIFDYGRVLTGPPDPAAFAELMRITGLSADRLDQFYWKDRNAYDEGKLTGIALWHNVARDAGLKLTESEIAELTLWYARMWTRGDPAMLAWQLAIKQC